MCFKAYLSLLGLLVLASGSAWAGSITFNFNTHSLAVTGPFATATSSTDLGGNVVYFQSTDGSNVLQASSVTCSGGCAATTFSGVSSADLFYKVTVGDPSETGLGLSAVSANGNAGTGDSANEIANDYGIVFNLPPSAVTAPYSALAVVGSVEGGEDFVVDGLLHAGAGSQLFTQTGGGVDMALLPGVDGFHLLGFSAPSGDVLVDSITFSTVPEPASLALFGTALLLVGLIALRRRALAN